MAMTSTIFPVKSALLLVAAILCNALTAAEEPNEDDNEPKQKWHVISSEESSDFPLISVGGESCLTLDLYDMETRKLNMSLKNITKAPVKIMGIIPGFPCLSLQAPIENATVEPNASLPVNLGDIFAIIRYGLFIVLIIFNAVTLYTAYKYICLDTELEAEQAEALKERTFRSDKRVKK